ncbi:hypothetical protein EDB84DRAFT_1443297 [Lactarius hengduanensis]|nr:hypothetical protein EDB84DRAFT_1443297 [Lactarius hengduanensis]
MQCFLIEPPHDGQAGSQPKPALQKPDRAGPKRGPEGPKAQASNFGRPLARPVAQASIFGALWVLRAAAPTPSSPISESMPTGARQLVPFPLGRLSPRNPNPLAQLASATSLRLWQSSHSNLTLFCLASCIEAARSAIMKEVGNVGDSSSLTSGTPLRLHSPRPQPLTYRRPVFANWPTVLANVAIILATSQLVEGRLRDVEARTSSVDGHDVDRHASRGSHVAAAALPHVTCGSHLHPSPYASSSSPPPRRVKAPPRCHAVATRKTHHTTLVTESRRDTTQTHNCRHNDDEATSTQRGNVDTMGQRRHNDVDGSKDDSNKDDGDDIDNVDGTNTDSDDTRLAITIPWLLAVAGLSRVLSGRVRPKLSWAAGRGSGLHVLRPWATKSRAVTQIIEPSRAGKSLRTKHPFIDPGDLYSGCGEWVK